MTDDLDDVEAALASLQTTQQRSHRVYRRTALLSLCALATLAGLDSALVVIGSGQWMARDLVMVGGLTVLGMVGYLGAAGAYRVVVARDAEIVAQFRKQIAMAQTLDGMKPLIEAIENASAQGVGLLIPPGELPPLPGDDTPTVH